MSNSYNYIDPDYVYTDPNTGLLRNLQNIKDPEAFFFVESGAVFVANRYYGALADVLEE